MLYLPKPGCPTSSDFVLNIGYELAELEQEGLELKKYNRVDKYFFGRSLGNPDETLQLILEKSRELMNQETVLAKDLEIVEQIVLQLQGIREQVRKGNLSSDEAVNQANLLYPTLVDNFDIIADAFES